MKQKMDDEIEIPIKKLQQSGWVLLGLVIFFTILGVLVSPLDAEGKPVLLLPEVRAVEDYRHSAQRWIIEVTALEGEITQVLSQGDGMDLFLLSKSAQTTLQHAVRIAQEVDRVEVPPVCIELHQEMVRVSLGYLEAARGALGWVSVPKEDNLIKANKVLESARALKTSLEVNPWLANP